MDELLKYYWIEYCDNYRPFTTCTDKHPFLFIKELNDKTNLPMTFFGGTCHRLTNWQRIEVEEYNLYRELNDIN